MEVRRIGLALAVVAGIVPGAWGGAGRAAEPAAGAEPGLYEKWIPGRLELGARFSGVCLLDSDRWDSATGQGIVGTIGHLDEEQTAVPYNVSVAYFPVPRIGLVARWERMEAAAVTHTDDHHVDGTYRAQGASVLLAGRWPLACGLVPYAEAGLHFPQVDFEPEDWWRLGYSSPADYAASDGASNHGHVRHMETWEEDSVCFAAGAGASWFFGPHWGVDANVRYVGVEGISHHYSVDDGQRINDYGSRSVPLTYLAIGVGAVYRF